VAATVQVEHNLGKHVLDRMSTIEEILGLLRVVLIHIIFIEKLFLVYLMSSFEILNHLFKLQ
jgi:hypothetical protein